MEYQDFIDSKAHIGHPSGVEPGPMNDQLFDYQSDITAWALRRGRAAIFADCGLGKTPMQLEWARQVSGDVLILAPLAVAQQTVREGHKFGIDVHYCRSQDMARPGINITNYEMLSHFDPGKWRGIVLDESSILKAYDGATRKAIIEAFAHTPYRLACTATPAPNDYMELGNHAEFLGVMKRTEMLSMYFVHDGGETQKWRLKGHAEDAFWRWLCSWAVMVRHPRDLGYTGEGFTLPKLIYSEHTVTVDKPADGMLFALEAQTLQERIKARRDTVEERVALCASLVSQSDEPWLVWCNLNSESDLLRKSIPGAVEVKGSDDHDVKEERLVGFSNGRYRVLITKPSIAGYGMNWQHCSNMAFVGLSDSWEQYYQAVRRCWRYGQKRDVNVHIISSSIEGATVQNIKRKERDAEIMANNMVIHMHSLNEKNIKGTQQDKADYKENAATGEGWIIHLGDCIEIASRMDDESVDYSIFSPPFELLYVYSNSDRDMGNCADSQEFALHFGYLIEQLWRVIKPGRLVSFHCMNLPTSKVRDDVIGLRDFRGELIRMFSDRGWIYHSEVCIWKDPVTAMQRTKALGLLHKQLKKDSCMSRQGIPDYLVTMRKPGDNNNRVTHDNTSFPVTEWQKIASPVWMDINPSDTLQYRSAREGQDERHICPLQLEVIRRAIRLWSNPGDIVFSPFAGIGSEGWCAIQMGRKFIGAELKESYWHQAVSNVGSAKHEMGDLLDGMISA